MRNIFSRKIILWSIATIGILACIMVIGASFYMLDYAIAPYHRPKQEAMERFFKREPASMKSWVDSLERNHCLRDTAVNFDGRGTMHALMLNATEPSDKVAIAVHGYKDRAESMLHIAGIYHKMGYNVLLPYLYSHGESEGDYIGMGWDDAQDVMRWMEIANAKWRGASAPTQMVLHGISMGAATVMCISGEKCPEYVKCIVEDCGYTSAWDEFASELRNQFDLPEFPLLYTCSALCKLRYGWSFGECSPLEQVKKSTLPMLFIHGDADTFVPFPMLDKLYQAKQHGYKEKYIAPGSEHARSFTNHPEQYTQRVKNFTKRFIS